MVGKGKVISNDDIVEAQVKRDAKEAVTAKGKQGGKHINSATVVAEVKRRRKGEVEVAKKKKREKN